jgi:hypothetical protein
MLRKTLMAAALALAAPIGAHAATIYLCKAYSGGTFWASAPCAQFKALIERIESVPDGLPFDQQVNLAEQSRSAAARLAAPPAQNTTTTTTVINNYAEPDHASECKALNARIAQLDAMARQPQSGPTQDWIAAEKKKARDRQFRVRC